MMRKDFESRMALLLAYAMLALLVMATAIQAVVTQPIIAKDPASAQNKAPNCSDGIQNQGELAVDCAGQCIISAEEICDSIDNDRDCYVDEGGICEVPTAKSLSDDVCAFPDRQIGYENRPDYFAIMSPSCVIEDDVGSLDYRSTLNLTKSYNAGNSQKETLQITLALYEGGKGGRCSALFIAYPDAAAAKKAAKDTENLFMPLKKLGNNYAYVNETIGIGYWVKKNYLISVTNNDYLNNHWWEEEDCTELLEAYLAKIGSDLSPASQAAVDEQASTIEKTSPPIRECKMTGSDNSEDKCLGVPEAIGAGQVPDENGMVMSCDVNETGVVVCKKVKASDLLPVVPDIIESAAGIEVVEGTPVAGEVAGASAAATGESNVEKVRRIAKERNIHLSNYSDDQLLAALQKFGKKHRKELEEKYGSQEPSEDKMAEILKQFSDEEFGKSPKAQQAQQQAQQTQQPQKQSLFSKVKSFFKKLF